MTNNFKKIAKMIREDYENGFYDFDDTSAWSAFCYEYGGENGKWNGFKDLYPEEAHLLEIMIEQSKDAEEEDY